MSAVDAALIEDVPGIVLHTMFFQKRDVFIFKRHLAMVRLLIQNIPLTAARFETLTANAP